MLMGKWSPSQLNNIKRLILKLSGFNIRMAASNSNNINKVSHLISKSKTNVGVSSISSIVSVSTQCGNSLTVDEENIVVFLKSHSPVGFLDDEQGGIAELQSKSEDADYYEVNIFLI